MKNITVTHRLVFSKETTIFLLICLLQNIKKRGRFGGTPYFEIISFLVNLLNLIKGLFDVLHDTETKY